MEHGRFFPAPFGRTLNHASSDLTCWNNFSYLVCAQAGACERVFCAERFLLCGAGLAELGRDVVQVLLRFLLTVGACFEEVCLRGRQGFRNQGHGLHTLLKHFGFP